MPEEESELDFFKFWKNSKAQKLYMNLERNAFKTHLKECLSRS